MGDVMFGGRFSGRWVPRDVPAHDPLERVAHLIQSDLAMANLETTVMSEIPELTGDLRFVATPDQVAVLPKNHITAVTLANNHINDVDAAGIAETPGHLAALGLTMIGVPRAEEPVFRVETVEVRGWKIGFVAGTTKLNRVQKKKDPAPKVPFVPDHDDLKDTLVPVITAAKADHDLVIVVLHWGVQYDDAPSKWQVEAAHAFIDAGASAVVGHHPHVLQGIERYKDGVIAYSLGNFVFQNANPGRRNTGVLRLGFARDAGCLDRVVFHPMIIRKDAIHYVDLPKPREVDDVGDRVIGLSGSKKMATAWRLDGDHFTTDPACAR
jgi:poly-gamma-glutamate synthesis protein (capsule biosynthesis protein)